MSDGIEPGVEVIVLSMAGRFRVVARSGMAITIESATGARKTVLATAVRSVEPEAETAADN